ncbi:hypothetical protein [Deinococcus peraridilitoris]|uniref:Uncharacterized protein n=1 Tax=Deinococcus peraridilitoris (strain DSM 19664 / LMG 22246 / CIP 109416 / KR-200) TaxID=937777 RepID=K9ZXL6_DEIPD|nr:hypothetical protein [Deinococcus peraridilitoris]AFZ65944.1 hypothetical protein Deipe_0344 [Deinococcus peraridilitoris DSM 19664]
MQRSPEPDNALTMLVLQVGDGYSEGQLLSSQDARFHDGRPIRLISPGVTGKPYTTLEYDGNFYPVSEPKYEARPRRIYCAIFELLDAP